MPYDYDALAELVHRIKNGDMTAFRSLYEQTQKQIYYFALKVMRNKEEAEDILQETYISAYRHIEKCKNDRAIVKWLTSIAYNHMRDRLAVLAKANQVFVRDTEEQEILNHVADDVSLEDAFIRKEDAKHILVLVEQLPEKQRLALFMYYFKGLSAAEIAEICDCKENAVNKRLFDARAAIKKKIQQEEREEQS
ncbi:MAG: RNA polymerase sigma factor [Oscillospiraceae bacterium]|nr:RNA polymerase sigma factor [Oscillospiraceae bacterium]